MTQDVLPEAHADAPEPERRAGELTPRELLRWAWRQLTSMRTALVLLLLLALAAIPGSLIPQSNVDSLKTANWQDAHPKLTPIYERFQLFSVYDSPWFAAIYILLMVSLVGCIIPRLFVYWRAMRAAPPDAPRHLSRLPVHTSYADPQAPDDVLARAQQVLRDRRYRVVTGPGWVAAERGYLREAGNLLFHLAVVVVLVGFAMGGLFGYKGGVIVIVGDGFSNTPTSYNDFDPGSLFNADSMEPFHFTVDSFDVDWLTSGPRQGMARGFDAHLTYTDSPGSAQQQYDLRVNHPLKIGGTELFLIGHGYAPVVTIRDGEGNLAYSGPTVFLPESSNFLSFGVIKAADAKPTGIGLEGLFFPTYLKIGSQIVNVMGDDKNPTLSLQAYTGDLGMDVASSQSVYELDKSKATHITKPDGSIYRVDLQVGQTQKLPGGVGSVTFEGVDRWTRIQISRTPGTHIALAGVVLALVGLLFSLFIRPRRVWVRAVETEAGDGSDVEIGGLDRSTAGDVQAEVEAVSAGLRQWSRTEEERA
jgi:cytochrome c biogenesis protein